MSRDERITFAIECFLKAYAFCFIPNPAIVIGEIEYVTKHTINSGDCGLLTRMVINRLKHFGIELEAVASRGHLFLRDNKTGLYYDAYYTTGSTARDITEYYDELITGDKLIEQWKSNFERWAYKEKIIRLPFDCLLHGDTLAEVTLAHELVNSQFIFGNTIIINSLMQRDYYRRNDRTNPEDVAKDVLNGFVWQIGVSVPQIAQALKYNVIKTFNKDNEFELDITSLSGIKLAKLSMRIGQNKYVSETEECVLDESVKSMPFFRYLDSLREQVESFMNNQFETGVSLIPVKRALAWDRKSNLIVEFEIDEDSCVLYAIEPKTPTYDAIVGYLK